MPSLDMQMMRRCTQLCCKVDLFVPSVLFQLPVCVCEQSFSMSCFRATAFQDIDQGFIKKPVQQVCLSSRLQPRYADKQEAASSSVAECG